MSNLEEAEMEEGRCIRHPFGLSTHRFRILICLICTGSQLRSVCTYARNPSLAGGIAALTERYPTSRLTAVCTRHESNHHPNEERESPREQGMLTDARYTSIIFIFGNPVFTAAGLGKGKKKKSCHLHLHLHRHHHFHQQQPQLPPVQTSCSRDMNSNEIGQPRPTRSSYVA